jgi:hypothetical protein
MLSTPFLDLFKRGDVAKDVRMLAAQGALAPRALEQMAILVLLLEDADPEVRRTADATVNRIPADAVKRFLARSDVPAALLEFFADRGVFPDEVPLLDAVVDEDERPHLRRHRLEAVHEVQGEPGCRAHRQRDVVEQGTSFGRTHRDMRDLELSLGAHRPAGRLRCVQRHVPDTQLPVRHR